LKLIFDMELLSFILFSCALSFVFVEILTEPNEIFYFYYNLIRKLPEWLFKPLGGCLLCFTGQLTFWSYIFIFGYELTYKLIFTHLSVVAIAILINYIFKKTINKYL
jgi:hypothetical protein